MQKYFTQKYYADKRQSTSTKNKALLALVWVSIFWGTTWLASKEAVQNAPALQVIAIRQLIAGVLYIGFFIFKKHPWPKGKQWVVILVLSFLNFMLSNALSTWGVKFIPSGLAAIVGAIFPLWLVIITMFKGKRLPRQALLGLMLGFGGVCIIFYEHLKDFVNPDFRFGIMLSICATISWSFGTLYTKQEAINFNPYFSLGFQMLFSGIIVLSFAEIMGNTASVSDIPASSWWAISYLVVIGSVLTFAAYIYTLQHLPTALASIYAYINPIVAVLLGALLVNEKLTIFIAIGGAITIAGVYLVNNSLKKKIILGPAEPIN
ncbi:MAG: drug/metabolite-transporting permease [Chitinophagaceae bacterium]|nr:drug/metabolite-transporting permease [Chitinophagaceae bacterium]